MFALGALALTMLPSPTKAVAGIEMDCGGSVRALALQGYDCYCSGGQLLCRGGKGVSAAAGMKAMIATTVVESLVTAIFAPPASSQRDSLAEQQKAAELAAQYLAQKKAREAEEQAAFERMMSSYKQLEGAAAVDYKALSNTSLSFKILDGDQEGLAGNARQPFDTPAGYKMLPPPAPTGGATAFFGDTMPTEAIQLLVKPENNPKVVDLRKAITFVAENLKTDGEKLAAATLQTQKTKGKQPAAKTADCRKLAQRLSGYVEQRNKFHKTILLAQDQLNTWQDANRNALVNAAKDGVEYFVGIYLEILKNRGLAADRLRGIFEKRAAEMARNGLDIRDIEAKIARLKALSSIGKFSDVANSANDWQTFIKDGMSGLVNQLTDSNDEIKGMLGDPGMQKYFTADAPELNALLDISKMAASGKVLGKWVAKQMPIIAMLELSVKQLYNATDWCLSFQQIAESNRINGEVMKAARSLQRDIDATYASLQQCP
ncbi:MAG: hypothetical protein JXB25_03440 [Deltaproteobacteria bacterium]|nr:hypothetical protein [Deltaproteobacteria bacterium]